MRTVTQRSDLVVTLDGYGAGGKAVGYQSLGRVRVDRFRRGNEASPVPHAAEHPMTAAIVLALTSQVTETSAAAITLIRSGAAELVAMPLVRTAYENALTAHWLTQVPDATPAFINEDVRSRRNLAKDLPEARGETFRASVVSFERQITPKLTTGSAVQARNFRDMCVDLDPAGMDPPGAGNCDTSPTRFPEEWRQGTPARSRPQNSARCTQCPTTAFRCGVHE